MLNLPGKHLHKNISQVYNGLDTSFDSYPANDARDPDAYKTAIDAAQNGKPHPNFLRGGLKEGYVKMSAYGPMVPDAAKKQADDIKAKMVAGNFDIFKGGLKDNKGAVVIPAGPALKQTDLKLEGMNYLVEGVVGSI